MSGHRRKASKKGHSHPAKGKERDRAEDRNKASQ